MLTTKRYIINKVVYMYYAQNETLNFRIIKVSTNFSDIRPINGQSISIDYISKPTISRLFAVKADSSQMTIYADLVLTK